MPIGSCSVRRRLFGAHRTPKTLRSSEQLQFIALLRRARKAAGLTQQELADKLDRPQSFVAKYENGERRIDVIEFVALAGRECGFARRVERR